MRTLMVTLILAILLIVTGCDEHLTAWGLVGSEMDTSNTQYILRAGVCDGDEPGGIEVGMESSYVGENGQQAYGAYGLMHLGGDQASWLGQPYIGYHATVADSEDGGAYGPIIGTIYWRSFVVEIQPLQGYTGKLDEQFGEWDDEVVGYVGFRREF